MASVDYLAGTYLQRSVGAVISDFADVVDGFAEGSGHHGYKSCHRAAGISIYSDGRPEMGVHVQVSGVGCGAVVSSSRYHCIGKALSGWLGLGWVTRRIDLAIDVQDAGPSPEWFLSSLQKSCVTSRWQDYSYWGGVKAGKDAGLTVYLGDRSSEVYLCVYDKRLEQLGQGQEVTGVWSRFEIRTKDQTAESVGVRVCCDPSLAWVASWLADLCQVRVAGANDVNRSRWRIDKRWRQVCDCAAREPLYVYRKVKSLEVQCREFERAYGQRLAVLDEAVKQSGGVLEYIDQVLWEQRRKLSDKSRNRIDVLVKSAAIDAQGGRQIDSEGVVSE